MRTEYSAVGLDDSARLQKILGKVQRQDGIIDDEEIWDFKQFHPVIVVV